MSTVVRTGLVYHIYGYSRRCDDAGVPVGGVDGLPAANRGFAQKRPFISVDTGFVLHYIRVVKLRLRNITVTLEENVAHWARLEAARKDTSVSRLLAGILKERMREKDGYEGAMRRALARKPFPRTDGRYLSREEVHDRDRLR